MPPATVRLMVPLLGVLQSASFTTGRNDRVLADDLSAKPVSALQPRRLSVALILYVPSGRLICRFVLAGSVAPSPRLQAYRYVPAGLGVSSILPSAEVQDRGAVSAARSVSLGNSRTRMVSEFSQPAGLVAVTVYVPAFDTLVVRSVPPSLHANRFQVCCGTLRLTAER